jgi:hypothetical protein
MRPEERTALELERGRIIAERKQRESDLSRLIKAKKVKFEASNDPDHPPTQVFYVAGVEVGRQNLIDDDYPSEAIMATILLAVHLTVGMEGVAPEEETAPEVRAYRNAYRDRYLGYWRDK